MDTTILIVDNEPSPLLQALTQQKHNKPYTFRTTPSHNKTLEILATDTIDIVIANVAVAEMDSGDFLQKSVAMCATVQFIIIGTQAANQTAVKIMEHHPVVTYLQQPITPEELHIHIKHCVEKVTFKRQLEAETIHRMRAEKESEKALFSRITISALLETGLEPLSLERQLEVALEIILTIPWLATEHQGAIFLLDPSTGHLELSGQINLAKPLLELCAQVPLGYCLCGKAAEQQETVFSNQIDDDHTIRYQGMQPHGHYCVPITGKNGLLGVMTLYLSNGHQRKTEEDALITTIANTLAIIIERRQIEAELTKAGQQLQHLAYHDPLTGLRNRQSFNTTIGKIFVAMQNVERRQHDTPSRGSFLAVFDIDHFKRVNDTYGHMMGDEVLVLFARHMNECFRDKDVTFRFGGEEFVVLLFDTSIEEAKIALNRFRHTIETFNFPQVGQVTVSIGAVEIVAETMTGDLLEKADQALYFSKSNGRNQVNFYRDLIISGDLKEEEQDAGDIDLWD